MLIDVEQLCKRINTPMSSTHHASLTNTETSKAERAKETHATSLTFIGIVFWGRSLFLGFDNRAASFWVLAWLGLMLGTTGSRRIWHWEPQGLGSVSRGHCWKLVWLLTRKLQNIKLCPMPLINNKSNDSWSSTWLEGEKDSSKVKDARE